MGTKNHPGAFDCYANAHPDEPMFILLGRDKHAPALVWLWAAMRELDGEGPSKVIEARECVQAMFTWQIGQGKQPVGVGAATLVGAMELVRAANAALRTMQVDQMKNAPTTTEFMRLVLAAVKADELEGGA